MHPPGVTSAHFWKDSAPGQTWMDSCPCTLLFLSFSTKPGPQTRIHLAFSEFEVFAQAVQSLQDPSRASTPQGCLQGSAQGHFQKPQQSTQGVLLPGRGAWLSLQCTQSWGQKSFPGSMLLKPHFPCKKTLPFSASISSSWGLFTGSSKGKWGLCGDYESCERLQEKKDHHAYSEGPAGAEGPKCTNFYGPHSLQLSAPWNPNYLASRSTQPSSMLGSQRTVSCLRPLHVPHSPETNHILQKDQLSSLSVSPCSQLPQSIFFGYEIVPRLLRTPNTGSSRAHSHGPWRRISPGSRRAESQERSLQDSLSISLLKQKGERCGRDLRTTPPLLSGNFPGDHDLTEAHPVPPWSRHLGWDGGRRGEEYHKMGYLERQRQ